MCVSVCVCPGGVAVTISVATVDKAVYRGGACNDAGTTETSVGEVSLQLLADHITSHFFCCCCNNKTFCNVLPMKCDDTRLEKYYKT